MKTQIVYVVISSEGDYFLEELWASLYSLRHFHSDVKVVVLTDLSTSIRIKQCVSMLSLITELKVIPVPENYRNDCRARVIKTNLRNLLDGDFLFIDTDTIICKPLDDIDNLLVKNIAMVPELHSPFKKHAWYDFTKKDMERIFDTDVSESPYWFNSGCMLVRDNEITHKFFVDWKKNWEYSAFEKNNASDQRALLKTDHDYGYMIECLPDIYNCQVAMSIQYFCEAKIIHFWHMRARYTSDMNYSPFCNKEVYKAIRKDNGISVESADMILHCKSSFRSPSMIVGTSDMYFQMSPFNTVLHKAYDEDKMIHWLLDRVITLVNYYLRAKNKLRKIR